MEGQSSEHRNLAILVVQYTILTDMSLSQIFKHMHNFLYPNS